MVSELSLCLPVVLISLCRTALHRGVSAGNVGVVKLLLEAGAYVNIQNTVGATPLHIAAADADEDSLEMVELLLSYSAHRNARTIDKKTPAQFTDSVPVREFISGRKRNEVPSLRTLAMRAIWRHHLSGDLDRLPEELRVDAVRNVIPSTVI